MAMSFTFDWNPFKGRVLADGTLGIHWQTTSIAMARLKVGLLLDWRISRLSELRCTIYDDPVSIKSYLTAAYVFKGFKWLRLNRRPQGNVGWSQSRQMKYKNSKEMHFIDWTFFNTYFIIPALLKIISYPWKCLLFVVLFFSFVCYNVFSCDFFFSFSNRKHFRMESELHSTTILSYVCGGGRDEFEIEERMKPTARTILKITKRRETSSNYIHMTINFPPQQPQQLLKV